MAVSLLSLLSLLECIDQSTGDFSAPFSDTMESPISPGIRISAWTFPWDASSFTTLKDWKDGLDEISPYWYYALENGTVIPSHNDTANRDFIIHCRSMGMAIVPMISNNHDTNVVSSLINNPEIQQTHIQELLNVTIVNGFEGVDINYENIPTSMKDGYSEFIHNLSAAFHSKGKIIRVSVFPKVSDDEDREGPGGYDYRKIGQYADSVRVMAYNLHWSSSVRAGPITSYDWVGTVINYSVDAIPLEKISLGIPLFGYDWIVDRSGRTLEIAENRSFTYISSLLREPGMERRWNGTSRTPYISYEDSRGRLHSIHYNDAESLLHELLLVRDFGISRISLWRIGGEDPLVREYLDIVSDRGLSNIPPYVNIGYDQKEMKGTPLRLGPVRAYDIDGVLSDIRWDVGDGGYSTLLEPEVVYRKGGIYNAFLNITDNMGCTISRHKTVTVSPAPVFEFTGEPRVGYELSFDGSGSFDLFEIVSYSWKMGDGTYLYHAGPRINHTYSRPGNFTVILTVIDSRGYTDTYSMTISVPDEEAPLVDGGPDLVVWEDTDVTFDGRGSSDNSGSVELRWEFPDGSVKDGYVVKHVFSEPGSYIVNVIGTDSSGRTSKDVVHVLVKDKTPPEILVKHPKRIILGGEISMDASLSRDNVGIENITWKLPSGELRYDEMKIGFLPLSAGRYHFTVDILDMEGNWNSTTFWVDVIDNEPPVFDVMIDPAPARWNDTYLSLLENVTLPFDPSSVDLFLVVNVTYRFLITELKDASGTGYMNWTFGDGAEANGDSVYHNWSLPGEYLLNLNVDDIYGNRLSKQWHIIVIPTVNFTIIPHQTYETVYINQTPEKEPEERRYIPIILGISSITAVILILTALLLYEVRTAFKVVKRRIDDRRDMKR